MESLGEMEQRLLQEGLSVEASSSERLALLWRLYVEKDKSARELTRNILDLRVQHAAEIKIVAQHVENIRSLSKNQDSAALDLQQDNEVLLNRLDQFRLLQEAQESEIAEMLRQVDLEDVISCSLSEQVAYLLAERSSLLEKLLDFNDGNMTNSFQKTILQSPEESPDQAESLRGPSLWKRLLGLTPVLQTRQRVHPASRQAGEENLLEERKRLERDVAEAASRLDMAHREIRRLTDELESARLAVIAYEPELQAAQLEVEQLRQEMEDLKRHDVAQYIKVNEVKETLEAEVHQLKATVHKMKTDCLQLLELIDDSDSDRDEVIEAFTQKLTKSQILSTTSSSKVMRKKALKDIHKRCREEMEEKLGGLQDLRRLVLNLQAQLEQETMQRKKAVEECEDQRKRREVAEDLTLQLQELQEQKDSDHEAEIQYLQEQIDLLEKIEEVSVENSQRQDRECAQHLQLMESLSTELDWVKSTLHEEKEQAKQQHLAEKEQAKAEQAKALIQSQEAQLRDSWTQCKRLNEELKRTRDLLTNSHEQLYAQSERNSQRHSSITVLEQENREVSAELAEGQTTVKQQVENEGSQSAGLQFSQQDLETCQPQEQEQDLFQHEQVVSVVSEIQHVQQLLKSDTQQLNAEKTLSTQSSNLEQELRDMVAEMSTLKNQVENSQQQWKRLAEREEELQLELESLLANNAQLTQAKAELAQQVQDLENKEITELRQVITNLKDKLTLSQQDYEKVDTQLQLANVNLSVQISKQHDAKLRHRERLGKAREVYLRETAWRDEKIVEQQRELEILTKRLQKESDMVKMVQTENEALLLNKKELLRRLNEEEEARADAVATVTFMQRRVDLLEKEVRQRDENLIKFSQLVSLMRLQHNCQSLTAFEDLKRPILFKTQISEGTV